MKTRKEINIVWSNIESIKKAERLKTRLENKGYNLHHTFNGFEITKLIFKK